MRRPSGPVGSALSCWEGEPLEHWRARWSLPRLEIHATLGSTNDRARELFLRGAGPLTVVLAEEQRRGRGRSGRTWHSPAGVGLWFSIVLSARSGDGTCLPLLVGLAVARGVESALPSVRVGIEWPNDLLVDGRKVGGVLCEAVSGGGGPGVVAGVGLNVSQRARDFPEELRKRAGSLEMATGERVARSAILGAILRELRRLPPPGPVLREEEWRELGRRDVLRGTEVETSRGIRGTALGFAPDGALEVEVGGKIAVVRAGSVRPVEQTRTRPPPTLPEKLGRE